MSAYPSSPEKAPASQEGGGSGDLSASGKRRPKHLRGLLLTVAGLLWLLLLFLVFSTEVYIDTPMIQKRAVALLAEIEGGLDDYKIDHGTYPINPAENRDEAALEGAAILYQHLSGDFDLDGEFDDHDPDAKIYVESFDYRSSTKANKGTVGMGPDGQYMATDPYGHPIRYLCDPPNRVVGGKIEIRTYNPTYDLWSTGGASPGDTSDKARAKWITNWGAQ